MNMARIIRNLVFQQAFAGGLSWGLLISIIPMYLFYDSSFTPLLNSNFAFLLIALSSFMAIGFGIYLSINETETNLFIRLFLYLLLSAIGGYYLSSIGFEMAKAEPFEMTKSFRGFINDTFEGQVILIEYLILWAVSPIVLLIYGFSLTTGLAFSIIKQFNRRITLSSLRQIGIVGAFFALLISIVLSFAGNWFAFEFALISIFYLMIPTIIASWLLVRSNIRTS